MNLIGLVGLAGSGKDTVADILVRHRGFAKVALADPIKRAAMEWFDFTEEQLWGPSEKRNAVDDRYLHRIPGEKASVYLTPRYALQKLGTEFGRHCYEDVWVNYALKVAKELLTMNQCYVPAVGLAGRVGYCAEGVAIPDVRFLNEVEAIRNAGGVVWKIKRPGAGLQGAAAQHVSETEQTSIPADAFEVTIHNNGTLEDLKKSVLWCLRKEQR